MHFRGICREQFRIEWEDWKTYYPPFCPDTFGGSRALTRYSISFSKLLMDIDSNWPLTVSPIPFKVNRRWKLIISTFPRAIRDSNSQAPIPVIPVNRLCRNYQKTLLMRLSSWTWFRIQGEKHYYNNGFRGKPGITGSTIFLEIVIFSIATQSGKWESSEILLFSAWTKTTLLKTLQ